MITCKLLIKEMPDGRVAIAMNPNQTLSTKAERQCATILDDAIQAASELMLKGKDIIAEGEGIKEYVKRFISQHSK